MNYRASQLAALEPVVGSSQALWISTVYFGFSHYFGALYGLIGALVSTFPSWLLGKAMLGTRGFFWAWSIHFIQDFLIFSFIALGSVKPGG